MHREGGIDSTSPSALTPPKCRIRPVGTAGRIRRKLIHAPPRRAAIRFGCMTSSDPVDVRRRAGSLSAEQNDLESWLAGHR